MLRRREIIVDHQVRRIIKGVQIVDVSGFYQGTERFQKVLRHKVGIDQKGGKAFLLRSVRCRRRCRPPCQQLGQSLQSGFRFPVIHMENMNRKTVPFRKEGSEEFSGGFIRNSEFGPPAKLP